MRLTSLGIGSGMLSSVGVDCTETTSKIKLSKIFIVENEGIEPCTSLCKSDCWPTSFKPHVVTPRIIPFGSYSRYYDVGQLINSVCLGALGDR